MDDPLEHDGRIRSFPHERGNWSTYVYIPCRLNGKLRPGPTPNENSTQEYQQWIKVTMAGFQSPQQCS